MFAIIFKTDTGLIARVVENDDVWTHGVVWDGITRVPNVYVAVSGYVDEDRYFHPATRYSRLTGARGVAEAPVSMAHPHDALA